MMDLLGALARLRDQWQQEVTEIERIISEIRRLSEINEYAPPFLAIEQLEMTIHERKRCADALDAVIAQHQHDPMAARLEWEIQQRRETRRPGDWHPIATAPNEVVRWRPVDLWMTVHASPMSFGMSDTFRVPDCWRDENGKWVHDFRGTVAELQSRYITHWMPLPDPPKEP